MKLNEFYVKNPKLIEKAEKCKSLDEFLSLAKENDVEFEDISLEESYLLLNKKKELSDDLLDNVAGGKRKYTPPGYPTETYPKSIGLERDDLKLKGSLC